MSDVYIEEAQRRLNVSPWPAARVLAVALQQDKWEPPVDPDEAAAWGFYKKANPTSNFSFSGRHTSVFYTDFLETYKAGKAAA